MTSFGNDVIFMLFLDFIESEMFKFMSLKYCWKFDRLFNALENDENWAFFFLYFLNLLYHFWIELSFFDIIHWLSDSLIRKMRRNVFNINVVNVFNLFSFLISPHCSCDTQNFIVLAKEGRVRKGGNCETLIFGF